jgi:hypothetical protein
MGENLSKSSRERLAPAPFKRIRHRLILEYRLPIRYTLRHLGMVCLGLEIKEHGT